MNRSKIATGSQKHRDPRFPPYAFTEHGAIMAATVINSPRAVEMSIYVVRAFVHLCELLASNKELAPQLKKLERKVSTHDEAIVGILKTIRQLMQQPEPSSAPSDLSSCSNKRNLELQPPITRLGTIRLIKVLFTVRSDHDRERTGGRRKTAAGTDQNFTPTVTP